MVICACECNFDIPGVEHLPAHSHGGQGADHLKMNANWVGRDGETIEEFVARHWPLDDEIRIWVPWKQVARGWALAC